MESTKPRFINAATLAVVVATTVPGWFQAIAPDGAAVLPLTVLIGAALAAGTLGVAWAERRPGLGPIGGVLSAYGAVVGAALWLSDVRAFLVAMPLASMCVLYLPLRAAIAINAGIAAYVAWLVTRLTPTGSSAWGGALSTASAIGFVFVFSLIARRERYARADVERLSQQVAELATARERNRIAREIHDTLGHCLTVANMQVEAARTSTEGREQRLEQVQQLLRNGLSDLRNAVTLLRERNTEKPFAHALEGLVADCAATGLDSKLRVEGEVRPLHADVSFMLYRAAQEALTNVRKHAQARRVDLELHYGPAYVWLKVTDDGVGGAAAPGNGLNGISERVAAVGGSLAVEPGPDGKGLQLRIEVPA